MKSKNIADIYPVSPVQQGMLFHTLYAPESKVYFTQVTHVLSGNLNSLAFERAWQHVVDRHPILRTAFIWEDLDEPLQVVVQRVRLPLEQHDWRGLSVVEQEEQLTAYLDRDLQRGFKLSKAPLMRLALIRLTEQTWHFIWSYHHLLLDGWSRMLILHEVMAYYEACCQDKDLDIAPARPYRDYIGWLKQQDLSRAEAFWRQSLKGFTAPISLRVDRGSSNLPHQAEGNRKQHIFLSIPTTNALRSLAREQRLTLNTVVQGVWALLLSRYSGEADVVFGTIVSGRPITLAGAESMVGLFINALPVRCQVPPHAWVLPWLKKLQEQQVELRQHEHSPLVLVQSWSELSRGLPLFESVVAFENYPVDVSSLTSVPDLQITDVRSVDRSHHPLSLEVRPSPDLGLQITYDCDRFDDNTIRRMLGHVKTILEEIATTPERRLSELSLLTAAERQQLMCWNDTNRQYDQHLCLHQLIEAQVVQSPDTIAVVFEDQQLTYAQLNAKANQLAHYLCRLGVRPEVRVGICLERSLEMVIGLLAVLKAGGAYVPLDPTYPQERLAFMVADAQAPILLTHSGLVDGLPSHQSRVVCLDTAWVAIEAECEENLSSGVLLDNSAYIIYTSGSTGKPKGVVITHRGICNRILWAQEFYCLTEKDRVLQKTPFSFDVSVWEFFWPLLAGAHLIVAQPGSHRDSAYLVQTIAEQQITLMHLVTPMLRVFVEEQGLETCNCLRVVICGGEPLFFDVQDRFFAQLDAELHNLYGPTEASVDVTFWPCERASDRQIIPIGRPIANTQIYIVDSQLQLAPVGLPGELYIGGVNLARGYLNRPELTAEKFIPNPFSDQPGARMYKTGDLARYLPDGNIDFLGRIDLQVKLRGFRIELGEIEAALTEYPPVRDAVVLLQELEPGDKRLVAYIVAHQEEALTIGELRLFLKGKLPDYMVPTDFILLDGLPLLPNGKVNRSTLLSLEAAKPELEAAALAPRCPIESALSGMWTDMLRLKRVGVHDSFFDLGGHSLLATQLVSRIRTTFQVELSLRSFFETPTIAGIAQCIETAHWTAEELPPPLTAGARPSSLPLSFAQQRLWFIDQLSPGNLAYNLAIAVRLVGPLNVPLFCRSLNEVVRRHESLRTTFPVVDGTPVQRITPFCPVILPVADCQQLPEVDQKALLLRLAAEAAQQSFDLARGPLLHPALLRLAAGQHVLLLTLHHIITDGWSMGILIRELVALYQAFIHQQSAALPELPIQYADYALWQRHQLQGALLTAQLDYWRSQLADLSPLALPTDRVRPPQPSFRGASVPFELPPDLTQALKSLSQHSGTTLFMTLLAAFQLLLARYTRQDDLAVGTPVANRTYAETESLIGCFVNTLVLRTRLAGEMSFRALLQQVRAVCIEAYAHQVLPFEQVVEALSPTRDLSRNPLFQVMFALENLPLGEVELEELRIEPLAQPNPTAKFDLTLTVRESADELLGSVEYATDLFDRSTIERLCGHYVQVLRSVVAAPEQRLTEIELMPASEQAEVLALGRGAQAAVPEVGGLAQWFEQQVARTPAAIAVCDEQSQLSYVVLNHRANQLAAYLRERGVGPEMRVGLCLERSAALVVALLGILKAQGAYVPLDPRQPVARQAWLLADAEVRVLVTAGTVAQELADAVAVVVQLDAEEQAIGRQCGQNHSVSDTADQAAYVLYTSGSTGQPKGVINTHRGVINRLVWMQQAYQLSSADRVLQKTPYTFDVSVWEFFWPLLQGATLVLARVGGHREPDYLIALIQAQRITTMHFVPSMLQLFMQTPGVECCTSLQRVISSGEALPGDLQERFFARLGAAGVALHNLYGPTEAAIDVTAWTCRAADTLEQVPIGWPIANTQIYVLDGHQQLVPIGVPGELYIGGVQLARGYQGRPDLTAERFVPDPFSAEPGARLYRSGDLARYRPDGALEYLGRLDHQVKLRGMRIELGEIEAVLRQHPAVTESVVILRSDVVGSPGLVAYVVASVERRTSSTVGELRQFLQARLPAYMVPMAVVMLAALPLTPSGKVDRRALPVPEIERAELAQAYVAPRTTEEAALATIWRQVLGVDQVGVHDNFFDLGGHSLLAVQVISQIRETFRVELRLQNLFETPTVAGLAEAIEIVRCLTQGLQAQPGDSLVYEEGEV
jgi:amino acid adenylation domain-containing protein